MGRALAGAGLGFEVDHRSDSASATADSGTAAPPWVAAVVSNALPDTSGLQFCHRLHNALTPIPSLLLFDAGEEDEAAAALLAGVDDILVRDDTGSYLKILPGMLFKLTRRPDPATGDSPHRLAVVVQSDPASTEYESAASSLRECEPFWRAMVENPFEYVLLVDKDTTIQYLNRTAPGVDFHRVLGKMTLYDYVDPAQHGAVGDSLNVVFQEGKSAHFDIYVPMLERWYVVTAGPLYAGGNVIGASVFARDITEQKRVEHQLKASERRFRQLAESIRDVFYILDLQEKRAVYVSSAYEEMFGRPRAEVYENAMAWMDLVHPGDREKVKLEFDKMVRDCAQDFQGGRYRIVKPDGSIRWLSHRAFVIRETDGESTQVAGAVADVTTAKEAEEELRRTRDELERRVDERTQELKNTIEAFEKAQRLASIGTLASGIAHEMNNPIGTILMAADTALYALDRTAHDSDVAQAIMSVKNEARRVARIVKTVLQLSRQESSDKSTCDLGDVARRARDLTRRAAHQNAIHVDLEIDPHLQQTTANPTEIEQVLVNVIQNAIEASRPGQTVSIVLEQEGDSVLVQVTDRGRGMTGEVVDRIFDPFYTTRQAEGGTGLGLSLTYSIVRQHNGSIEVDSQPGKGSRVSIRLPVATGAAPNEPQEA